MGYKIDYNKITYLENGEALAVLEFPECGNNLVDIKHTFVDDRLRGRGIGAIMMEECAKLLESTGRQAILTCSYARYWFDKHSEFQEVVYLREIDLD